MKKIKKPSKLHRASVWIRGFPNGVWRYFTFLALLTMYLLNALISWIASSRLFPKLLSNSLHPLFSKLYSKTISLNRRSEVTINRINLIDLAIKNMLAKRSRTLITIGGMAVGIGAIVLLQSVGYGLQELVISRATRLEEMRQINVSPQIGSNLKITDATISDFAQLPNIEKSLPQIALVGRVNYQDSNTDVAVYGVTTDYLKESAIQTSAGEIFDSNAISLQLRDELPTNEQSVISEPATTEDTDTPSLEILNTSQDLPEAVEEIIKQVPLGETAIKQAVINRALLNVLGLTETEAIGKTFDIVFVVVGSLLESTEEKIETYPETYTITGVSIEDDTPFLYVPFIDLRGIGITNYSQLKVIVNDEENLMSARQHIEAQGFTTESVVDTISQIDSLFGSLRIVLAIVGLVAVAIAALGMFNTLTVSLLERTREVGFMKAMGMKSHEIKDLFLTESLIMGLFGGALGLFLGYLGGLGINLLLSIISWSQGGEYIDVTYIPLSLTIIVAMLSLFVGIFTGFYPARRATNISALNALRYE